jgi:hypothetical protein
VVEALGVDLGRVEERSDVELVDPVLHRCLEVADDEAELRDLMVEQVVGHSWVLSEWLPRGCGRRPVSRRVVSA